MTEEHFSPHLDGFWGGTKLRDFFKNFAPESVNFDSFYAETVHRVIGGVHQGLRPWGLDFLASMSLSEYTYIACIHDSVHCAHSTSIFFLQWSPLLFVSNDNQKVSK